MAPVKHPPEWQKFFTSAVEEKKPLAPVAAKITSPTRRPHVIYPLPLSRIAAKKLFDDYLKKNTKVSKSIRWSNSKRGWYMKSQLGNAKYWRSYRLWPATLKNELKRMFIRHALEPGNRLFSLDTTKTAFTFEEVREVYLSYVAHSLYLDIFRIVPWKLEAFDDGQLRWLFDGRYFAFNFAVEVDKKNLPDATSKYCFGYVEKRNSEIDPWNYYPIATPALPGDPALLFEKLSSDLALHKSPTLRESVSGVARWCQNNLSHGQTSYAWGGGVFTGSSWVDQLYPSSEVIYLGRMDQHYIRRFRQKLNGAYITPRLPAGVSVAQLVDKRGVFADPAMGQLDAQGNLQPPSKIGFMKHCTYSGCQTTGGLLHWLFKAINVPACQYSCFMGDVVAGNYPGAFHKGIEVSVGKTETVVVGHSDHLYQGMGIYHPDIPGGTFVAHFRDPHIDLLKVFLPKNFQEWWLPPYNISSATADPAAYGSRQNELYYTQMIMTGAVGAFSSYVIDWWKAYEQAGRVVSNMNTATIPWMVLLNKLAMPAGVLASVLNLAETNIRSRIDDIENGVNTQWGTTLADYEAGFLQWDQDLYDSKAGATLWTAP